MWRKSRGRKQRTSDSQGDRSGNLKNKAAKYSIQTVRDTGNAAGKRRSCRSRSLSLKRRKGRILKMKLSGRSHMLLAGFLFLFAALLFFTYSNQKSMVRVVAEYMDDGLTTALMAAGVINLEEHSRSRQIILHNNLPDELFEREEEVPEDGEEQGTEEGGTGKPPEEIAVTDAPGIGEADEAVRHSYELFKSALQTNLRLDAAFRSKLPVIVSDIKITEYSVYNVFRNIDTEGNFTGKSRICRYRYRNGNWLTDTLGEAGSVSLELTRLAGDHTMRVNHSTVYAELTFDVKVMPANRLFTPEGFEESDNVQTIHYKRAVDITVKYQ